MGIEFLKDERDKERERIRAEVEPHERSTVANADPRYRYRGVVVHPNRPGQVDYWKSQGYEVVPADAKEYWAFGGRRDPQQGGQFRGDQILMRTPREIYERRVKAFREKQERRIRGLHEEAKERINKLARDGIKGKGRVVPPHTDAAVDEVEE